MPDRWIETYRWWLCVLSGILLVLGFAPFASTTCGWIALVPAWLVITRSETTRRQPIRHGYLIGLIYFAGTFWWISDVTVVGAVILILYVAFYPGIWFLLIARVLAPWRGRTPLLLLLQAAAAAAFWVTLESWRSWFLTGFDWDEIGATQSPSIIFRQLAAYGGVPLISFALVFTNILWAEFVISLVANFRRASPVRLSFPFAAALFTVAVCFAFGWHHLMRHRTDPLGPPLTYACIQPDINPVTSGDDTWQDAALKREVDMSMEALKAKPDLLIWPEAIIDEGVFQDRPLNDAVHSICEINGGYFLLGSQDYEMAPLRPLAPKPKKLSYKLYNCAYFFGPHGDEYDYYYKTRLVVWGEYLPLGDLIPGFRKWAHMGIDFTPGETPRKFTMAKPAMSFAPLICFEDTLAEVPAKAALLNPDFFVDISNDAWYTGWFATWGVQQHLNLARFRCVEHDRPMIRCTNNGVTCEIDQDGSVTHRLKDTKGASIDTSGIFAGRLRFYPTHGTLYESWGNWIVLLSGAVSVIMSVYFFCRPARSRES